ncbi:hypothetical protein QR680_016346 [Steinernema hermaphroditum]|uniref:Uncharacterized protein n=1 Tax=Steinernema hermaphroditum TaxID=289476 RepID=A0AA39HAY1_9BILA|nr:hypothetical protein QR680_016346 [Steinernema hermaphroditum]
MLLCFLAKETSVGFYAAKAAAKRWRVKKKAIAAAHTQQLWFARRVVVRASISRDRFALKICGPSSSRTTICGCGDSGGITAAGSGGGGDGGNRPAAPRWKVAVTERETGIETRTRATEDHCTWD